MINEPQKAILTWMADETRTWCVIPDEVRILEFNHDGVFVPVEDQTRWLLQDIQTLRDEGFIVNCVLHKSAVEITRAGRKYVEGLNEPE